VARRRSGVARRVTPSLSGARVAGMQARVLAWYAENARDLPWRATTDPYAVLVSETMLQQTQVGRVVARYGAFLRAYPTLESLADAPLADVLRTWRGLGYNNRAERLWRCARHVVAQGLGDRPAALPSTLDGLLDLPGVGPYTARAVLIFARNADLAAVDANVRRVLTHELALDPALPPGAVQSVADAVLPRGRSRDWHNALMDYGSLVLTARATGLTPRTRQGPFQGSRRWHRSRILRTLLEDGPQELEGLAVRLDAEPGFVVELVRALERDGLVRRDAGRVAVA